MEDISPDSFADEASYRSFRQWLEQQRRESSRQPVAAKVARTRHHRFSAKDKTMPMYLLQLASVEEAGVFLRQLWGEDDGNALIASLDEPSGRTRRR
jgi:hypothetical protein